MIYDYCVGIDFGTTNTIVCYFVEGEKKFLNPLPSVIFSDDKGKISVGLAAQNNGALQPENMITSAKKFIGNLEIDKTWNCDGYIYSPTDVATEILKEVRRRFIEQNNLAENAEIGAVITVPANFNDNQRNEIRKAAETAGFEILWILEDSTAAALETFYEQKLDRKILVVDIGGGEFDVSLLETDGKNYRAIDIDGEDNFGGDDFDRVIFRRIISQVEDELKLNLSDAFTAMIIETEYNKLLNRLMIEARRIKEFLTTSERAEIHLKDLAKFDGKNYSLNFILTRKEFDEICQPLYDRIFDALEDFVTDNENFKLNEIGYVILAGGTCKIPYIQQKFSDTLGNIAKIISGDLKIVAGGAARLAEIKNNDGSVEIKSVLPHSLGVAIMYNNKLFFDKLIDKGTPYPCEVIREYETVYDNQTRIDVNIYEAGNEKETDLRFHRLRGTVVLNNIPPAPNGKTFIDVKFEYTEDQSLRVTAIDKQRANHFERQIIEKNVHAKLI